MWGKQAVLQTGDESFVMHLKGSGNSRRNSARLVIRVLPRGNQAARYSWGERVAAKSDDFIHSRFHFTPSPPRPPCLLVMSSKVITFDELKAHATKDSLYILLHGKGVLFLL